MSDLSDLMDGLSGNSSPAAAPPAKPSGGGVINDITHAIGVINEGISRGIPNTIGFLGDIVNDAPAIIAPGNASTISGDPVTMPGFGPVSQAISNKMNANEASPDYHVPDQKPRNELEEALNVVGQGIGGALTTLPAAPANMAARLLAGGVTGAAAGYGAQKAGGGEIAQTLAALVGGGVPFIGAHGEPVAPHEAGAMHPDFHTLANEVIPTLEGGGSIENPKTNPTSKAFGPMQVTPDTLKQPGYGIKPWDGTVADSIRVGQQKLAALLHRYDGDVDKTLAAYNWGEGNVDRVLSEYGAEWLNHVPEETFNYVHKGQRLLGGVDTPGSVNGSVEPMAPEDIKSVMDNPLMQEGAEPNALAEGDSPEGNDLERLRSVADEHQNINSMIDSHLGEAHAALDDLREGYEPDLSRQEVENYRQGAKEIFDSLPDNHPLLNKAAYAKGIWDNVADKMDNPEIASKPVVFEQGSDKFLGQEPRDVTPANENPPRDPVDLEIEKRLNTPENIAGAKEVWEAAHEEAMSPHQQPDDYNSAVTRQNGGTGRKFTMTADEAQAVLDHADEAVRKYWQDKADAIRSELGGSKEPPQEPPSGGRGGGSGMGGDFGGGEGNDGQPPEDEGEPKYADSVNLNRIKISQDAKQLIKDQLLPANTDIETHEENKVKAMSYIDRHGVDNILSGFHKVEPDELSAYQTAVRALSAAGKQNVADLAKQFPDERTRTPEQADTIRNAIEMSGRATTLDNAVAKQLGRSMSARRIYMGGNAELSKLLDGAHIDGESLNKLVDKINAMPSQAGDIAADAMKPGWLDYVKSAYYGISLLSRLSTPIGIFASVSASHITEALTHTAAAIVTMPGEARAWGSWAKGWAKGFDDLPTNIKQAWQQGIPTDKANLIQSRVNLPGPLGFPSKIISSVDEFFGTLGRSAKAYSDAGQRAYSEGFRGNKFTARVEELVKNMTPAESKIVEDYGKFARLQDAPTPLGRLFKAAVNNKNPMISLPATVVLPFVNIADRLFMYSVRMTPGISFTDRLTQRDFASSPTGKAVAINRQIVGASVAAYTVSQVITGNITGQGPQDPNKKAQWLVNHQPDSIKIGDKWVSYSRLPFSGLMSAAATATERYQETGNGQGYMKAVEGMFIGAGAGLLHSHYLEGVANLADTLNSGSPDKLADFGGRTAKSFIPGIEQSINEALVDPNVRDTKGSPFIDNIKAGLMGASQTLPAKHDVYGNPIPYEGGAARLINPFPTKTISNDPTINTLDKVNSTTSTSVVTPAAKTIHVNGQAVKLSEQGYQKYQALSGQLFKQAMSGNNLSGMSTEERVKFVKETLRDARSQAKTQLWGV